MMSCFHIQDESLALLERFDVLANVDGLHALGVARGFRTAIAVVFNLYRWLLLCHAALDVSGLTESRHWSHSCPDRRSVASYCSFGPDSPLLLLATQNTGKVGFVGLMFRTRVASMSREVLNGDWIETQLTWLKKLLAFYTTFSAANCINLSDFQLHIRFRGGCYCRNCINFQFPHLHKFVAVLANA